MPKLTFGANHYRQLDPKYRKASFVTTFLPLRPKTWWSFFCVPSKRHPCFYILKNFNILVGGQFDLYLIYNFGIKKMDFFNKSY